MTHRALAPRTALDGPTHIWVSPRIGLLGDPGLRYAAPSVPHRKVRLSIFHIKRDTTVKDT
jgi:hypothetical protein